MTLSTAKLVREIKLQTSPFGSDVLHKDNLHCTGQGALLTGCALLITEQPVAA